MCLTAAFFTYVFEMSFILSIYIAIPVYNKHIFEYLQQKILIRRNITLTVLLP